MPLSENNTPEPPAGGSSTTHEHQAQITTIVTTIVSTSQTCENGRLRRILGIFFEDFSYGVLNPRIVRNIPESVLVHPDFVKLLYGGICGVCEKKNLPELILTIEDPNIDLPETLRNNIKRIIQSDKNIQEYLQIAIAHMEKHRQTLSRTLKIYQGTTESD